MGTAKPARRRAPESPPVVDCTMNRTEPAYPGWLASRSGPSGRSLDLFQISHIERASYTPPEGPDGPGLASLFILLPGRDSPVRWFGGDASRMWSQLQAAIARYPPHPK